MMRSRQILNKIEGKSKEEQINIIQNALGIDFSSFLTSDLPCKAWLSIAFCYCTVDDLNEDLIGFSIILNLIAFLLGLCYKPGDVTSLGCTCDCGSKIVVLHFSLSRKDCNSADLV